GVHRGGGPGRLHSLAGRQRLRDRVPGGLAAARSVRPLLLGSVQAPRTNRSRTDGHRLPGGTPAGTTGGAEGAAAIARPGSARAGALPTGGRTGAAVGTHPRRPHPRPWGGTGAALPGDGVPRRRDVRTVPGSA